MLASVLQTLLEVQKIDRQLLTLEKAKGDLPQRLAELKQRLASSALKLEDIRTKLAATERERRALEGAISLAKERKKKYETQLFSVKNNKEYDAITLEIETTEKEIDQGETKVLGFFEEEKKLNDDVSSQQAALQQLEQEAREQEAELNLLLEETKNHVTELTNMRAGLAQSVKPNLLRTYERILRSREDSAVVQLSRGGCGGCGTRIPPQRMMEIREMKQIFFCENCGRILVWQEDEEAVAV